MFFFCLIILCHTLRKAGFLRLYNHAYLICTWKIIGNRHTSKVTLQISGKKTVTLPTLALLAQIPSRCPMDKKKFAGNPTGVVMMAVINVLFNQSLVVSQSCLVPPRARFRFCSEFESSLRLHCGSRWPLSSK